MRSRTRAGDRPPTDRRTGCYSTSKGDEENAFRKLEAPRSVRQGVISRIPGKDEPCQREMIRKENLCESDPALAAAAGAEAGTDLPPRPCSQEFPGGLPAGSLPARPQSPRGGRATGPPGRGQRVGPKVGHNADTAPSEDTQV